MHRVALTMSLALALPSVASALEVTGTNQNGGTYDGIWSCAVIDGIQTCNGDMTLTTADGQPATKQRSTTFQSGQALVTASGTRLNGQTYTRSYTVTPHHEFESEHSHRRHRR